MANIDVNSIIMEVASEFGDNQSGADEAAVRFQAFEQANKNRTVNNMSHSLTPADQSKENVINRTQFNNYNASLGDLDNMNDVNYVRAGSAMNNAISSGLGALCICKKLRNCKVTEN